MNKRWTYKVVKMEPSWLGDVREERVQEELNRLGAEGWELVNTDLGSMNSLLLLVFKKEA